MPWGLGFGPRVQQTIPQRGASHFNQGRISGLPPFFRAFFPFFFRFFLAFFVPQNTKIISSLIDPSKYLKNVIFLYPFYASIVKILPFREYPPPPGDLAIPLSVVNYRTGMSDRSLVCEIGTCSGKSNPKSSILWPFVPLWRRQCKSFVSFALNQKSSYSLHIYIMYSAVGIKQT